MKMYYVAMVLPEELNEKVKQYKLWMLEQFNCRVGLKSPAHITLLPPFWMEEEKEASFRNHLNQIASGVSPFPVATEGFAAFAPRTIFIKPRLTPSLQQLKEKMDALAGMHPGFGAKADARPFQPHITIATRDLFKRAFAEAWSHFENRSFETEWMARNFSLLRHNGQAWEVVHTASFQGQ